MGGRRSDINFAVAVTLATVIASRVGHALTHTTVVVSELLIPIMLAAYRGGIASGMTALITALISFGVLGAPNVESVGLLAVNGSIVSWLSERLRADRTRATVSERQFMRLFDSIPMPLAVIRLSDLRYMTVNETFLATFERKRAEIVGHTSNEIGLFVDMADRDRLAHDFRREGVIRGRELQLQTKNGEPRIVIASVDSVAIAGEPHLIAVYSDLTERLKSQAALAESDARFRDLTEAIHEVFWLTDSNTHEMLYISPAYERIWGRPCTELMANSRSWLDAVHPEDRARVVEAVRTRQRTGQYDEQYRIVRPDGTQRTIRDRGFVVRDARGIVLRIAGLAEDRTEQLHLEDQLRQVQKLESLGMLAGGVAHDFNNILAVVASCTGLLADSIPHASPDRELVDEIDHAVTRATGLTRQLLAFSRRQVVEPVVLDVNACVNETRRMLRRMVGEDILFTTSLEPELQRVRVDAGYLVQVIMNLVVNARDAMPRGGSLDLTTRNVVLDEAFRSRHPGAFAGPAVSLAVRDTGCGMSPEVMARIFEPFFTTKSVGQGTGMGLSVVRGIVEQAGGFLEVESTVGVGTTFAVYLPGLAAAADQLAEPARASAMGLETLLLVDDDEHVRRAASRALRARGFTVLEAAGGDRALQLIDAHPEIALLVTDVVMPGMDGRDLVHAARTRRPALRTLYVSGYTDEAIVRHGAATGKIELLEKPFRLDCLAAKVRHVLDHVQSLAA